MELEFYFAKLPLVSLSSSSSCNRKSEIVDTAYVVKIFTHTTETLYRCMYNVGARCNLIILSEQISSIQFDWSGKSTVKGDRERN